ncbi:hypothetical protein ACR6C2_40865 [Streptomyces sp. INA 01156]
MPDPVLHRPGARTRQREIPAVSGGPAFSLFVTAATRGAVPVPNTHLSYALSHAPLPVLDDLVDHGGLMTEDRPWTERDEDDALYLRARLAPRPFAGRGRAPRLGRLPAPPRVPGRWTVTRRNPMTSGTCCSTSWARPSCRPSTPWTLPCREPSRSNCAT